MSKVVDRCIKQLEEIVENNGLELVDITYKKNYNDMALTLYIDKVGGVSLNDCELIHNIISPVLDEIDPTDGESYILNVSSPGLDRPYKTERDFKKHIGDDVEISLYKAIDKLKKFEAKLVSYNGNEIEVEYDKKIIKLNIKDIAVIHTAIKF